MKKILKVLIICFACALTNANGQQSCTQCSGFNCAFDGITGPCVVSCGINYNYSVAGTISQPPIIFGGNLVSYGGNSFSVNWSCGVNSGAMEVRYMAKGRNFLTEGQVCICPEGGGTGGGGTGGGGTGGGSSNYCELINLNCASDGINGPCNVLVGANASYSVSTTGTIVWKITINGNLTQLNGNPISFTWPSPGPYVADIEVLRNGLHFTEGMVCVDTN
ncbi:MAG: hypothetical protein J0L67_16180 [Cytophagales bacterium]|nr:hypothetical protein [Cytophagales bacterium]